MEPLKVFLRNSLQLKEWDFLQDKGHYQCQTINIKALVTDSNKYIHLPSIW